MKVSSRGLKLQATVSTLRVPNNETWLKIGKQYDHHCFLPTIAWYYVAVFHQHDEEAQWLVTMAGQDSAQQLWGGAVLSSGDL